MRRPSRLRITGATEAGRQPRRRGRPASRGPSAQARAQAQQGASEPRRSVRHTPRASSTDRHAADVPHDGARQQRRISPIAGQGHAGMPASAKQQVAHDRRQHLHRGFGRPGILMPAREQIVGVHRHVLDRQPECPCRGRGELPLRVGEQRVVHRGHRQASIGPGASGPAAMAATVEESRPPLIMTVTGDVPTRSCTAASSTCRNCSTYWRGSR